MKEDKNTAIKDAFSEQIRQKLANHTMPVDDALWGSIQQKISPQKRVIPWWTYASVGAVAAIALLFTVGSFLLHQQQEVATVVALNESVIVHEEQQEVTQSATTDHLMVAVDAPLLVTAVVSPQITITAVNEEDLMALTAAPEEDAPSASIEHDASPTEIVSDASPTKVLKEKLQILEADWTNVIKKKEPRKVLLAAGVGSGIASSSATIPGRSRAYRQQGLVDVKTNYNRVLTPNDFSQKHYLPPVTVGLSVRLPLNKRFSLESGLLYTYLTTRLSGSSTSEITAETNLHYAGLPLNLITSLMKGKHWEVYVSTGATVEKGLRSEFKQYQDDGNTLFSTSANTSIDGLQWSINASLGVAYHLNQHLSLFLDPKLSYYFENEQPYSIRSDMPMLIGLNTGLRMTL